MQSAPEGSADLGKTRKSHKGIFAALAIAALVYFGMSYLLKLAVLDGAKRFVQEQFDKRGIKGYQFSDVIIPNFALVLTDYQVAIILSKNSDIRSIEATIRGNCLFSTCLISVSGSELMRLLY